jgi:hypothetical protein
MVYQVPVELGGHSFPTNMIILKDQDIDVILGMNWMSQRGVMMDTLNRTIKMKLPDSNSYLLIQLSTPRWGVEQICATSVKEIADTPIVRKFPNVFLKDLCGLPLD